MADPNQKQIDDLMKALSKPRDLSKMSNRDKSDILALSFIGSAVVDRKSISPEAYKAAVDAFNTCPAGKIEKEAEAIKLALDSFYPEAK